MIKCPECGADAFVEENHEQIYRCGNSHLFEVPKYNWMKCPTCSLMSYCDHEPEW